MGEGGRGDKPGNIAEYKAASRKVYTLIFFTSLSAARSMRYCAKKLTPETETNPKRVAAYFSSDCSKRCRSVNRDEPKNQT